MTFTPIGAKIIKKMLVVITILGALNVTSLYYIKKIELSYSDLINRRAQILTSLQNIQTDIFEMNSKYQEYLLTNNPEFLSECNQIHSDLASEVSQALLLSRVETNKEILEKISKENDTFKQKADEVISATDRAKEKAIDVFNSTLIPISQDITDLSENLIQFHQNYMEESASRNTEFVNKSIFVCIMIMVIDVMITAGIIYYYNVKMKSTIPLVLRK